MASPSVKSLRALIRYGNTSPENLAQLETWQAAALTEIAANKGGDIVSGSTNGSAFTKQTSMSNAEWFALLSDVLNYIDNGTTPQTRTVARLN